MPAVAASGQQGGGDELGPGDEIKVFKDEGEDEREQGGSETLQAELLEEKSSLITESEVSKIKKMELCRKRLCRLNHSVCSASTTLLCPLVASPLIEIFLFRHIKSCIVRTVLGFVLRRRGADFLQFETRISFRLRFQICLEERGCHMAEGSMQEEPRQ